MCAIIFAASVLHWTRRVASLTRPTCPALPVQASGRLNAALEQIKAAGLPIPPAPTSVPAFPNDVVGSQQTVSASPSGSGLQLLAAAATPTASAAAQQAWMSPAAGGAAAATLQALFGGGQQTPSAGLSAEGLASLSGLLLSPAKPASPAKPSAASLAQSLAAATSTPLVPLTPTAKKSTTPRKRPATDEFAGTSRAAAGPSTTPPDGTRSMKRKVQVVQRTSWPKPGAQAPDWNKRAAALAAVAAAAEREAAGDSDSATTNSETELAGGNDGGERLLYAGMWGTLSPRQARTCIKDHTTARHEDALLIVRFLDYPHSDILTLRPTVQCCRGINYFIFQLQICVDTAAIHDREIIRPLLSDMNESGSMLMHFYDINISLTMALGLFMFA